MEVVNRGEGDGDPTNLIQGQSGDIQVRHILLILSARDLGDIPGGGAIASLAKEGHDASLGVVVALGSGGQETTASADVVPISIVRPMAGTLAIVRARCTKSLCWQGIPSSFRPERPRGR